MYQKLPKFWGQDSIHAPNAKAVVEGYLDAFDPDFVVKVGSLEAQELKFAHRKVISCSEILKGIEEYGAPRFGVGMIELLRHFAEEELRFVRHHPLRIVLPEIATLHNIFLSSVFGAFPKSIEKLTKSWWKTLPGVENKGCNLQNYSDFLFPGNLFLRRIGSLDIEPLSRSFRRGDCIFFMDATNNLDVIDYWNLRALGWTVIPVCRQVASSPSIIKLASEFVEENSFAFRGNPNFFQ